MIDGSSNCELGSFVDQKSSTGKTSSCDESFPIMMWVVLSGFIAQTCFESGTNIRNFKMIREHR